MPPAEETPEPGTAASLVESAPSRPPESASSTPPSRAPSAWQLRVGLLGLLAYSLLSSYLMRPSAARMARAQHASDTMSALRTAKIAYSQRQRQAAPPALAGRNRVLAERAARAQRALEDQAISQWRAMARGTTGTPGDWRRLGLLLLTFGRPGGKEALLHATRPAARSAPSARPNAAEAEAVTVPPEQERRLWQAFTGDTPLSRAQVPALRATLSRLNLGWFEPLAAAQLYARAGMAAEAAQARAVALAGTRALVRLSTFQVSLLGLGLLGLGGIVFFWRRLRAFRADLPPAPRLFSSSALLTAFVLFLAASLLIGLPLLPLRGVLMRLSDAMMGRVAVALGLLLYLPTVGFALWALRRLAARESPSAARLSLRAMLAGLGFRSPNFAAEVGIGLLGYCLCLPLLLGASALSERLFHNFPTPPHPVVLSLMAMRSPLDMVALLFQTAVAAPLVEELTFRGMLYPALRPRWGVVGGAILSGSLFALMHPTLPGGFLPLATLGACFALACEYRNGSLWPSVVMHGLNNGLLLLNTWATLST
ncbi:MAG TPA: CPBP family glutamic-type intramembrane protease [Chthonomonadaceae bacterium]|nr:CPBP family glutamic-type intramembrane protease [Chthonomonadaceae bacterium]